MGVVLVVDSEGDAAKSVGDALAGSNRVHATVELKSGGAAIFALQKNIAIDVIVSDDRLEDMDGIEFLASVRKVEPTLPVILISRHLSVESYLKAVHAGAYDFFDRPVSPLLLRRVMTAAMKERAQARRPCSQGAGTGVRETFDAIPRPSIPVPPPGRQENDQHTA